MQTLTGTEVLYIHININDIYEKCELSYTHTHLVHWRVCICVSHVYTPGTFKCVQYMHLCVLWLWKQLKKAAPCENVSAQKKTHATLFSHQYSEHRSFNSILILYLLYPQRLFYCHFHCQHEYICSEGTQGCRLYSLVTRWQGTKKKKIQDKRNGLMDYLTAHLCSHFWVWKQVLDLAVGEEFLVFVVVFILSVTKNEINII